LTDIVGPKGLSAFDGYGIQVQGLELRQMMNMMNYNLDYYPRLVENIGFEKEVDFERITDEQNTVILFKRREKR
jgi:ABC-type enterochelin transport system substrate-binding protein